MPEASSSSTTSNTAIPEASSTTSNNGSMIAAALDLDPDRERALAFLREIYPCIRKLHDFFFIGNGNADASETKRFKPLNTFMKVTCQQGDIHTIHPQGSKGGVMHGWAEGMLHRVTDDTERLCFAVYCRLFECHESGNRIILNKS